MFVDDGTDHPDQPAGPLSGASQPPLATLPGTATHPSLNIRDAGYPLDFSCYLSLLSNMWCTLHTHLMDFFDSSARTVSSRRARILNCLFTGKLPVLRAGLGKSSLGDG